MPSLLEDVLNCLQHRRGLRLMAEMIEEEWDAPIAPIGLGLTAARNGRGGASITGREDVWVR